MLRRSVLVAVSMCALIGDAGFSVGAITLSADPNSIVAGPCKGCGSGSTDLEAVTALTIKETGGAAGTVAAIAMELRENGTTAVIASGEFNGDGAKSFAGSNRLRAADAQGDQSTNILVVPVAGATATIPPATQPAAPAPTPPPVDGGLPVVSPDGSHIVFSSDRGGNEDLFIISSNGTGETQLTQTPEEENAPGWMADSKHVVFSVFANETSHFYSIDLDGKNQREISSVAGRAPMLSPDGKRLLYMAGTWTATRLMVSALDGSNARQVNDGSSIAWNNHWSPDGKRIAFTGKNESAEGLAVFVMNADGSGLRQVTQIEPEEGRAQWPVWSPNGRQLAIQVSNLKAHSGHVWTVDIGSGEAHKLAVHDQPYLDETPSWFPDGKRIAFQSNRSGRMEVWLMNADGSGQRQITGARQEGKSLQQQSPPLPPAPRQN